MATVFQRRSKATGAKSSSQGVLYHFGYVVRVSRLHCIVPGDGSARGEGGHDSFWILARS